MDEALYIGGCLCGNVRYRIASKPLFSRLCWCRDCQRVASNGSVNALFTSDSLTCTGTLARYDRTADSGNVVTRTFCPTCGSHLFGQSSGRPGLTVLRIGTLDDPSAITPTSNIWAASAPAWACIDRSLDVFDRAPPAPAPAKA